MSPFIIFRDSSTKRPKAKKAKKDFFKKFNLYAHQIESDPLVFHSEWSNSPSPGNSTDSFSSPSPPTPPPPLPSRAKSGTLLANVEGRNRQQWYA